MQQEIDVRRKVRPGVMTGSGIDTVTTCVFFFVIFQSLYEFYGYVKNAMYLKLYFYYAFCLYICNNYNCMYNYVTNTH